jgi:glycosyltransferase involved in cell wall biosynthesis
MKILFISQMPWRILRQRPHQIASRLASKGHNILFVNSPVGLTPSFFISLIMSKALFLLRHVSKNLLVCNVFLPPFLGKLGFVSKKIAQLILRLYVKLLNFKPDIAIFYSPTDTFLLDTFRSMGARVVYDCVDEFSAFSNVSDISKVLSDERELASRSEIVIASSRKLWDKFLKLGSDCFYVPNGVEYTHFHKAVKMETAPEELKHLSHPIAGFIGNIEDWVDVDLICFLADSHPNFSILLVGPVNFGKDRLERRENITMVGHKDYSLLPQYLAQMDACLIPFKINNLTVAANPIKLYEYLAAGKPVVSTALPEVRDNASGIVYIGEDYDDFLRKVELAVRERESDSNELFWRRVDFAKANSWEERVNTIEKLLLVVLSADS